MKIRYSRDVDVLLIELDSALPIEYAEQTGSAIVHMSEDDQPVLIEILQAHEFVTALVDAVMQPELVS